MNAKLRKAIQSNLSAPPEIPALYEHTDCNAIPSWAEEANFRQVNCREKKSKTTRRVNQTSGDFYAPKRWKKDNPHFFLKGAVNA